MNDNDKVSPQTFCVRRRRNPDLIVIAVFLNNVSHATTTSFSIPDYSMWLHSGSFQVTVSASTLSNVSAWQVNLTWTHGDLNLTSFTYGSPWTGVISVNKINRSSATGTDSALIGFALNNGPTYSSTNPTTMFTAIFRILAWPSSSSFHITTSSDTVPRGLVTIPANADATEQSYNTTDGSWSNCLLRPGP